jgi:hypothetical protein
MALRVDTRVFCRSSSFFCIAGIDGNDRDLRDVVLGGGDYDDHV